MSRIGMAAQVDWGAMRDGESDEFKRILLEGNPYFLALTFSVSLLHTIFDMLAFKNDIGFWKNKKSVEGLSVRTILFNCACQVLSFLILTAIARLSWTVVGKGGRQGTHPEWDGNACLCMWVLC